MSPRLRLAGPLILSLAFACAGCATQKVELKEERFQQVRDVSRAIALESAARFSSALPGITLPKELGLSKPLLVGGFPQANTAEAMVSGHYLRDLLLLDLRQAMPNTTISRLEDAGATNDALMLHGVVRYRPGAEKGEESSWFEIEYSVRKYPDAEVLLSGSALVNARHFDATPTRFYRDAPIYFGDEQRSDLVALASDKAGEPGVQRAMRRSLAYESARGAYDSQRYETAVERFEAILAKADGDDLLALSGKFQSLWKLGRKDEAEQAFGRLIDAAIGKQSLSIKFLFSVKKDDFDTGNELFQQYPMWIRQLARSMKTSGRCFEIRGHSSRSGSAEYNDNLSELRARRVARYLLDAEPELRNRVSSKGYGFRENIIGSGSDDASDAIDRRVDFSEISCKKTA